jgi:hypothetical protein
MGGSGVGRECRVKERYFRSGISCVENPSRQRVRLHLGWASVLLAVATHAVTALTSNPGERVARLYGQIVASPDEATVEGRPHQDLSLKGPGIYPYWNRCHAVAARRPFRASESGSASPTLSVHIAPRRTECTAIAFLRRHGVVDPY